MTVTSANPKGKPMTTPSNPTVQVVQPVANTNAPVVDPAVEKTAGRIARGLTSVKKTLRSHVPHVITGAISAVVATKLVQRSQDSNTELELDVSDSNE